MELCPHCDSELKDGTEVCPACGRLLVVGKLVGASADEVPPPSGPHAVGAGVDRFRGPGRDDPGPFGRLVDRFRRKDKDIYDDEPDYELPEPYEDIKGSLEERIHNYLGSIVEMEDYPRIPQKLLEDILETCIERFRAEGRRVVLTQEKGTIFLVGGTYGDVRATRDMIERWITGDDARAEDRVVFLGDYVDRGEYSEANLIHLLAHKCLHPDRIYMIMGDHEAFDIARYRPAEFWQEMALTDQERYRMYSACLLELPFMMDINENVVCTHGGLPLCTLEEVEGTGADRDDENWFRLVHGDFTEEGDINLFRTNIFTGRDSYDREYFETVMDDMFHRSVLIRAQNHTNKGRPMFDGRCLTLYTSAYHSKRGFVEGRLFCRWDLDEVPRIEKVDDISLEVLQTRREVAILRHVAEMEQEGPGPS